MLGGQWQVFGGKFAVQIRELGAKNRKTLVS